MIATVAFTNSSGSVFGISVLSGEVDGAVVVTVFEALWATVSVSFWYSAFAAVVIWLEQVWRSIRTLGST
jgi:hypothetical protein